MQKFVALFLSLLVDFSIAQAFSCFPNRGVLDAAIDSIPAGDSGDGYTYTTDGVDYGPVEDWCFDLLLTDCTALFRRLISAL